MGFDLVIEKLKILVNFFDLDLKISDSGITERSKIIDAFCVP
jgi:hypothetical protein